MTKRRGNHGRHGMDVCRWLGAAALAGVSLTLHAQPQVPATIHANTAGFGAWYFGGGAKLGAGGTGLTAMPNTPTNPTNLSGWTRAGNFGVAPGATGITVTNEADFSVPGGGKAKVNASAKVTPASAGKAIGNFAMKVAFPLQVGIAAYELFTELGVTPTRSSDGTLTMTKPQPNMGYCNGDNSTSQCIAGWSPVWPTPASVCSKMESDYNNAYGYMGYTFVVTYYAAGSSPNAGPYGWCDRQAWINGVKSNFGRGQPYVAGVQNGTTNAPYSITDLENEIASKSGWPTNSPVARALRDAINAGEPVQLEAPTVSGPATVNGPKETTNNPDGSRQEKQTVYNFNYAGDTINYTTTVVTTTYNSSNVQTGQTTTTTENEQPKPEDHCKTNPDTVGCMKLGEPPTGDIPKTTKTVSFTAENLSLGGGSCPPPYTWTDSAGSHAISLQPWCDFASSIIKPLLLAFAALSAYFIVAGAVVKD